MADPDPVVSTGVGVKILVIDLVSLIKKGRGEGCTG